MPSQSEHFDCIILGAGIAGISAAQELSTRGLSVVVLEARDRVGGRLHTAEVMPGMPPVDLGGAWIHGLGSPSSLNSIYALALRCGLQVRTTDYEDAVYFDSQYRQLPPIAVNRLFDLYHHFAAFVATLVARQPSIKSTMSVDDAVQLYSDACGGLSEPEMRELLFQIHNEIESYWAADSSSMAIGTMDEVRLPGADAVLCGGYGQLVQWLAAGLDIRTNTQATQIAWTPLPSLDTPSGQQVTVATANGGLFTAPRVIVTLPLGVLQARGVAFSPPLEVAAPKKAAAITRLGTGMYNKVMLVFDAPFWDNSVMIHRIPPAEERGRWAWVLNLHRVLGIPALVAFTTGSFATAMEQLPDEAVAEELMSVLRCMYPGKVTPLRRVVCTRWGSDPFSRMSYTYIPVGASADDCELLRVSLASQLYFAGEATSRLFYGTVHAAYGTGLQAAQEVFAAHQADAAAAGTADHAASTNGKGPLAPLAVAPDLHLRPRPGLVKQGVPGAWEAYPGLAMAEARGSTAPQVLAGRLTLATCSSSSKSAAGTVPLANKQVPSHRPADVSHQVPARQEAKASPVTSSAQPNRSHASGAAQISMQPTAAAGCASGIDARLSQAGHAAWTLAAPAPCADHALYISGAPTASLAGQAWQAPAPGPAGSVVMYGRNGPSPAGATDGVAPAGQGITPRARSVMDAEMLQQQLTAGKQPLQQQQQHQSCLPGSAPWCRPAVPVQAAARAEAGGMSNRQPGKRQQQWREQGRHDEAAAQANRCSGRSAGGDSPGRDRGAVLWRNHAVGQSRTLAAMSRL